MAWISRQTSCSAGSSRPTCSLLIRSSASAVAVPGHPLLNSSRQRSFMRTPAALREHLLWKRRNGTKDLLPAAEIAAIIAADEAWLEARNGRMRRRQKA